MTESGDCLEKETMKGTLYQEKGEEKTQNILEQELDGMDRAYSRKTDTIK